MKQGGPSISLIWAMAENGVIGRNNQLPWRLSADLRHFKALTEGKPILMGRKTWESLPGLLPNRPHFVITRDTSYIAAGCTVVHSIDELLMAVKNAPEAMVVGGAQLYAQMLPYAQRLYLTLVHTQIDGDTFFPECDLTEWREVAREKHTADEKNSFAYSFVTLQRR